ncbi:MAG: sigma-54-dependent Fis family transcriptional regulator [Acidobacteria bacterium]|nr:MAG: sigma-54-dependent Fis family transcriptional regulator [Acidobacteriota bacterium]
MSEERVGPKYSVLILEDEPSSRELCSELLGGLGFDTVEAASATRALAILEHSPVDIVLTDVRIPGMSGIELLKAIKQKHPDTEVVIMTGYGTIPSAVEAMKLGAYDYLTKPFAVEEFQQVFKRLVEIQELTRENHLLREQLSGKMQKIYRLILKAAAERHHVLILGESGTGKELVARAIHAQSPWANQPFVPVDCGALTPSLIESELFGHVRGAFTGASQSRQGLLAAAGAGTLFLDEIAELPVELQVKLLRALQEREIKPLGSNERVRLEARIIAATNQDIEEAIQHGAVRKDLYFRLNVVSIKMPPLRERKSDIPALVHYFIDQYGGEEGRITGVSYEAMTRLMNYNWPGNVRELENAIQRGIVLGAGPLIQVKDLPSNLLYPMTTPAEGTEILPLDELARRAILQALEATGGDRLRAAKLLGIGKTTIYRKIRQYGLEKILSLPETA